MAIPSRQIGWSNRANLLWQISKQLEYLTCVTAGGCGTTTTTTTTVVPTTTTTTTALCNYLYEGVLTVGGDFRGSGYQSGNGAIDPIDSNFSRLFYTGDSLSLDIVTLDCYSTIDVYINGIKYTLTANLTPGTYSLDGIANPFPAVGETCIIQICPGELCP